jgi:hypothetical protein
MDPINIDVTWGVARDGNDLPIPFITQNNFFFTPELKRNK